MTSGTVAAQSMAGTSPVASHPIPVCHGGCVLVSPRQRDTEHDGERGWGEQPPPWDSTWEWGLGSPAQPGNPSIAVFWGPRAGRSPSTMPPSPAQFLLSPDALTPPLHRDGEAPAGTGQPGPHPVPVTPAHGGGIGFLQPHPARPPSRGDEGDRDGTSVEPHVRGPRWSSWETTGVESGSAGTGTGLG